MAQGSRIHRATDALPNAYEERNCARRAALLGHSELFAGDAATVSGMGIPCGLFLLVYQWHHLPGKTSRYLVQENEDMPAV